jgi:hypothetical protein
MNNIKFTFIKKYIDSSYFNYEKIRNYNDKKLDKYIQQTHDRFKCEATNWNYNKNNLWILRLYASLKMLLSSTVFYSNYEFSQEHKIYLSLPYLEYYGLISSCRALLLLNSNKEDFSIIFSATHNNIINSITQLLKSIDIELSIRFQEHIIDLKENRERFSYHLPTKKIFNEDINETFNNSIYFSKLIAELVQLNSEILENNVDTESDSKYFIFWNIPKIEDKIFKYFNSKEDFYRLSYIARKVKKPINIHLLATEGLTEDFLGNYIEEYAEENQLGALHNLQLIFPFD